MAILMRHQKGRISKAMRDYEQMRDVKQLNQIYLRFICVCTALSAVRYEGQHFQLFQPLCSTQHDVRTL